MRYSIRNILQIIKEGNGLLSMLGDSDFEYTLERYEEYKEGLFRLSPFQIGSTVQLVNYPGVNKDKSPGWWPSRHFLVNGSVARVADMDYYKGEFRYDLVFNSETWIDDDNKVHQKDRKSRYNFSGRFVGPINEVILDETCVDKIMELENRINKLEGV